MVNYTYNFEIKDLLTQFVAAFDDTVIKRYDKNNNAQQEVAVRYVFAPKQRIMYDIINKAQNIELPVVAINLASVSYDTDRVFNKLNNFENYANANSSSAIRTPTPVNLNVNMSILCRYMQDMEQILSNFIPYSDPYIILSWKEPVSDNVDDVIEIRSEVQWDQTINLNTPTETTYSDKFRIIADTSFTIKGWLFRTKNEQSAPIYFIENNFINSAPNYNFNQGLTSLDYDDYFNSLSADCDIDTFTLSGIPDITNVFFNTSGSLLPIDNPITVQRALSAGGRSYTFYGDNYNETEFLMLSSNSSITTGFTSVSTEYTGDVSGYLLPRDQWSILNNQILNINIPALTASGEFDVIIKNPAGWKSSSEIDGFYFTAE
ncbi:tail sheath stabilizer and completion protein [bacterium]|nr:tail sheath stabilizer and completion protein [bacterium]